MDEAIARIKALILKHLREELSVSEQAELQLWASQSEENQELFTELTDPDRLRENMQEYQDARLAIWDKIEFQIHNEKARSPIHQLPVLDQPIHEHSVHDHSLRKPPVRIHPANRRIWAYTAAACLFILCAGAYFWQLQSTRSTRNTNPLPATQDIAPGSNKASLTLANGSIIILDKASNGHLAEQGATSITKDSNLLTYAPAQSPVATLQSPAAGPQSPVAVPQSPDAASQLPTAPQSPATVPKSSIAGSETFNTLTTPRSGQFQLELPDGSKVWLNNASSLRYPTSFRDNDREVTLLSGEAYFEIAPRTSAVGHSRVPFTVNLKGLSVKVLGTSFNISAYPDENFIKTTLITGKVQLTSMADKITRQPGQQTILHPAEQASISQDGTWTLQKDMDTEEAIAWKRGYFHFSQENIQDVLRQLARWYDVDIQFNIPVPGYKFDGEIGRDLSLLAILNHLEKKDMHFHIEGKKLIVSKE